MKTGTIVAPLTEAQIKAHAAIWIGDSVNPENPDLIATIEEVTDHAVRIRIPSGPVAISYLEIIAADKINVDFHERGQMPVWKDFKEPNISVTDKRVHNYSYAPPIAERVRRQIESASDSVAEELKSVERRLVSIFEPANINDERERIIAAIVMRRGQSEFRKQLVNAYKGQCAITGCAVEDVLEAAHIIPYKGPETNHPANGILLRSDLHTLFDLGLVAINPETMHVLVSPKLDGTPYSDYSGKRIMIPDDPACQPSRDALELHVLKV